MNTPIIKLKPGKEKALKNFHPWIFSGAIAKKPSSLSPGELVSIVSHQNEPLALGHYCGEEGIVARIITFDSSATLDENFWHTKFAAALALRKALNLPNAATTGFRLIHGEGDGLSGLVCDVFGKSASIILNNPGLSQALIYLKSYLQNNLGIEEIFSESPDAHAEFLENNLKFIADIGQGQKTGHFLDQRDNRQLVRSLAHKRRVLDAFCYSGGFSVYALAGGAQSVSSVDISPQAISQTKAHVTLNGPFEGKHHALSEDCFNYLRKLKPEEFDMIILDPPAFAKNKGALEKAARGYKDINLQALKALASQGLLLTFSCSQHISVDLFKKIIFAAAKDSGREVSIIHELTQGADHPVSIYCPQSSYLKGLALYVS